MGARIFGRGTQEFEQHLGVVGGLLVVGVEVNSPEGVDAIHAFESSLHFAGSELADPDNGKAGFMRAAAKGDLVAGLEFLAEAGDAGAFDGDVDGVCEGSNAIGSSQLDGQDHAAAA